MVMDPFAGAPRVGDSGGLLGGAADRRDAAWISTTAKANMYLLRQLDRTRWGTGTPVVDGVQQVCAPKVIETANHSTRRLWASKAPPRTADRALFAPRELAQMPVGPSARALPFDDVFPHCHFRWFELN